MADELDVSKGSAQKSKRGKVVTIAAVLVLMVVEGVGIFFLANSIGGPPLPASAGEGSASANTASGDADGQNPPVEIELVECRPSNSQTGKMISVHIRVSALVAGANWEQAKELVERHKARLEDRVNFVVRSADPRQLAEPGLETIKRRLKREFDHVLGDPDLILEVFIPQLLQSGTGI